MLKVSFIDTAEFSAKKVQVFNGKATVVTLTGILNAYPWLYEMPDDLRVYVCNHPFHKKFINGNITLVVQGKAIRAEGDEDSPIYAERIAEARAKIKLYRYMFKLSNKIANYLTKRLHGNQNITIPSYSKDSVWGWQERYREMWKKEIAHLNNLLVMS